MLPKSGKVTDTKTPRHHRMFGGFVCFREDNVNGLR